MTINRRDFLVGSGAASLGLAVPTLVNAQKSNEPIRIGLLTVKTGPLASGGIDMERGIMMYLNERNNMMAGRKVELVVADTGGVPANTKTKVQELVERIRYKCSWVLWLHLKRLLLTTTLRLKRFQPFRLLRLKI